MHGNTPLYGGETPPITSVEFAIRMFLTQNPVLSLRSRWILQVSTPNDTEGFECMEIHRCMVGKPHLSPLWNLLFTSKVGDHRGLGCSGRHTSPAGLR